MELTGTRTETSEVTIEVSPNAAFDELDNLVRKQLNISSEVFLKTNEATGKPELYTVEHSYHNGDPYDVLVDPKPLPEVVRYLSTSQTMREYVTAAYRNGYR